MSSNILRSKSLLREIGGGLLLSLGGAATWVVYNFLKEKPESGHKVRIISTDISKSSSTRPESIPTGASQPAKDADDLAHIIQKAMNAVPASMGYEKVAWTAPLLAKHLRKEYAMTVPLSRIKTALKDLDYHWKGFHYEKRTEKKS